MEAENKPPLPSYNFKDAHVSTYWLNPHLLSKNSKKGPDEIFPCRSVIYTQNVNDLPGKDKQLESMLYPLVDIMISKEIMTYCVKETWVVRNTVIMVRGHMIFLHNRCEREEGNQRKGSWRCLYNTSPDHGRGL